jgi:hypothetical protein
MIIFGQPGAQVFFQRPLVQLWLLFLMLPGPAAIAQAPPVINDFPHAQTDIGTTCHPGNDITTVQRHATEEPLNPVILPTEAHIRSCYERERPVECSWAGRLAPARRYRQVYTCVYVYVKPIRARMKRKELIKKLIAKGARRIRQGGNHEFWESPKGWTGQSYFALQSRNTWGDGRSSLKYFQLNR